MYSIMFHSRQKKEDEFFCKLFFVFTLRFNAIFKFFFPRIHNSIWFWPDELNCLIVTHKFVWIQTLVQFAWWVLLRLSEMINARKSIRKFILLFFFFFHFPLPMKTEWNETLPKKNVQPSLSNTHFGTACGDYRIEFILKKVLISCISPHSVILYSYGIRLVVFSSFFTTSV